jgi:hypothetical protein
MPSCHSTIGRIAVMPASQRPHDTSRGGISCASSFTEALRPVKKKPEMTATAKPRATREGIRRESASLWSIAGADIVRPGMPTPLSTVKRASGQHFAGAVEASTRTTSV